MKANNGLSSCPFCDGKAEIIHVAEGENAGGSCVCCTQCLASSNIEFEFKENFVSNWNRRALPKLPGEGDARPKVIATMKPPLDTAGHSPLPWSATGQSGASIYDANGMYVAMHVTLADRALIIEAVNASTPTNAEATREEIFTAGFRAAERVLCFDSCDESGTDLATAWETYRASTKGRDHG